MSTDDKNINYVVQMLSKQIEFSKLSDENVSDLVIKGMIILSTFKALDGQGKKQLLLDSIVTIISTNIKDQNIAMSLNLFIQKYASSIIDAFYFISTDKTVFAATNGCLGCFSGNPV